MRSPQDVLASEYRITIDGVILSHADSISDNGQVISAFGVHNGQGRSWNIHLPEPGAVAIVPAIA